MQRSDALERYRFESLTAGRYQVSASQTVQGAVSSAAQAVSDDEALSLPQRYGSQFRRDASGALQMFPVEDEPGLDARRAAMGMEPIASYRRRLGAP